MLAHRNKHNPKHASTPRNENDAKAPTRFKFKCSFCKIAGHKYADCRKRKKQESDKANNTEVDTFLAEVAQYSTGSPGDTASSQWCLDSGCTSHLCKDIRMMIKPTSTQSDIKLANNATSSVRAKGEVELLTQIKDRDKRIKLQDALHVPDLRTNLLSVAKIADKGYRISFDSKQATIQDHQGNTKLIVKRQGDLYLLEASAQEANIATLGKKSKIQIWHERLGHLNMTDLLRMSKTQAASGLKLRENNETSNCKVCIRTQAFNPRVHRSQRRLEIIYSDLCGPMRTNSIGGARYFMTIIDDHSRWCHVYFLKSKSEASAKFTEYKKFVENQTGLKIKAFHSDNGKEFCNSVMDTLLKESGIQRRLTIPHTPEQNGIAERKNRTLVETARCLLDQSNLPTHFWAEAINTASYIRNRCISKSLDGRTPHELWHGTKPDISHFRSFGCKVLFLNKTPNKGKFEPRAIDGILVGYDDTSRGYRIWVPKDRRIIVARDVKFLDENDQIDTQEELADDIIENKMKGIFDDKTEADTHTTKIGSNRTMDQPENDPTEGIADAPAEEPDLHIIPSSDEDVEEVQCDPPDQPVRGPGRPRRILTGKPGRPAKQYHLRGSSQQREPDRANNATRESSPEDEESSDDPEWFDAQFVMSASEIPFSQAVSGPNGEEWRDAIYDEIKSLVKNDTWTLVDRPEHDRVIGCRTVLRNKYQSNGELERRKARVVAKGFSQRPGIDFHDTYAPVARLGSLRLLIAAAVERDMQISQIDIITAYLNGTMDTTVHMEKPEYLQLMIERIVATESDTRLVNKAKDMLTQSKTGDKVCRLNKAIYGLRQAGRQWHSKLDTTLRELGLTPTNADPCVYHDQSNHVLLLVYVDDIIVASQHASYIERIKKKLADAFTIKDLGAIKYCLGIEVHRTREGIHLSQSGYTRDILERFGMSNCKPSPTPMNIGAKLHNSDDDTHNNDSALPYRELLGSLMYLAQGTRPDIAYAVSALSQCITSYNKTHWTYAKRVLRYLKGTIGHGLTYTKSNKCLTGFADADWGSCSLDRRSYTGTVFLLSNAAISWEARKQKTVALSSTEAEYSALGDAAREAIYLSRFLSEIGLASLSTVTLHNDNQGAGKLAANPVFHSRSKHIDIRCHFIRQALIEHPISLVYTPTEEMIADVLTKALPSRKHQYCIEEIGMRSPRTARTQV